jgi:hypothetical protein
MQRYKKGWYDKRIKQNKNIKMHLINLILKYKEKRLDWSAPELFCLNYEDLFEIAVAAFNKKCNIVLGDGQDWSCGRDGKVSIVRTNNYGKNYSAGVTGCSNKDWILALVYEPKQEKFYYFSFPAKLKEHSIPFDVNTGEPKRDNYMWREYECKTFEIMVKTPFTI